MRFDLTWIDARLRSAREVAEEIRLIEIELVHALEVRQGTKLLFDDLPAGRIDGGEVGLPPSVAHDQHLTRVDIPASEEVARLAP